MALYIVKEQAIKKRQSNFEALGAFSIPMIGSAPFQKWIGALF